MALLNRFFQGRKNYRNNGNKWNPSESNVRWKCPKLERDKIRLIIFGDNDRRGRQLLFDSKAIIKVEDVPTRCKCRAPRLISKCQRSTGNGEPGVKYQYSRPGSDVKMLEEMMFGAVAMSFKGSAMKVHFIKAPAQLMLTKVFIPDKPKRDSTCDQEAFDSCSLASSSGDLSTPKHISGSDKPRGHMAQSVPVDVPSPTYLDFIDDDSGLASMTSSGSFQTSLPSPSNNSSGYSSSSFNSLHRRWMRNQTTSLETCLRKKSSLPDLHNSLEVKPAQKQSKLGVGIMFDLFDDKDKDSTELFQNFFFSHITLFEGHVEKLKSEIERGYYNRRNFCHIIMEALEVFRNDIYDLYTAPRLSEPVWLNMMAYSNYRYVLCEQFMKELMNLVAKFDNKNTNFFVSTLVTAVLTHHLAWVPTVTPAGGTPSKTYLDKHSAKWLDTLARTHPYNPLWAQLGDLYGAIGFPLRTARTVVVGKKADLVNKFLYILSYFIRCSEVHENASTGLLSGSVENLYSDLTPVEKDRINIGGITLNENDFVKYTGGDCWGSMSSCDGSVVSQANTGPTAEMELKRQESCPNQTLQEPVSNLNSISEMQSLERNSFDLKKSDENHNSYGSQSSYSLNDNRQDSHISSALKLTKVPLFKDHADNGHMTDLNGETQVCRLFNVIVEEKHKVEDLRHVRREAIPVQLGLKPMDSENTINAKALNCDSAETSSLSDLTLSKGRSLLSEQLSGIPNTSESGQPKTLESEGVQRRLTAKANFLKEGSNSMFDEYFEDDSVTKTIDDINSEDLVTTNPLLKRLSNTSTGKVDSNKVTLSQENLSKKTEKKIDSTEEQSQGKSLCNGSRPGISRQVSTVSQHSDKPPAVRPTSLAPGRCRSVTPTELGRRRHLSSTSSFDFDTSDPLVNCKEVPLLRQTSETMNTKSIKTFERNFGRSLMAGYSDHYLPDFVLHGTSENNFHHKLLSDLNLAIQHPVLDEPVSEAVCVIADTDNWTVEVMSSNATADSPTDKWVASQLVCNLLEAVHNLWKLKMSPEFCLMHLEDRLQEIFFKSRMLTEYIRGVQMSKTPLKRKDLTDLLGLDSNNSSDLQLLMSIAGTNSPTAPL